MNPGSGVFVPMKEWRKAKSLPTAKGMTKFLMPVVFGEDELRESNYRGGGDGSRKALDTNRIDSIQGKN